ncbi:MAG TPA: LysE family translocator [Acidimicrobiales bacterium]
MSWEFLVTSVVVAVIPGTGVVYTVSSALGGGWRRGLFAALGCTLGIVPHVLAALLGLSGLMQAGAVAFEVVRWAGVAYLVFMGVTMWRDRGALRLDASEAGDARRDGAPRAMTTVVWRGILVNLLNPKLTVFFLAFLPQFLDGDQGLVDLRLIALGAVFMLVTLVVFAGYAALSAFVREKVLAAPRVLRRIQRALGALVVGAAARLALTDS